MSGLPLWRRASSEGASPIALGDLSLRWCELSPQHVCLASAGLWHLSVRPVQAGEIKPPFYLEGKKMILCARCVHPMAGTATCRAASSIWWRIWHFWAFQCRYESKGRFCPSSSNRAIPGSLGSATLVCSCSPWASEDRCKCGEPCPCVLCSGISVQTLLPSFSLQICSCRVEPGSCLKPTISFRSHLPLTILNLLTYVPINYWYNVALFRLVSADGYIITRQTFARQADR